MADETNKSQSDTVGQIYENIVTHKIDAWLIDMLKANISSSKAAHEAVQNLSALVDDSYLQALVQKSVPELCKTCADEINKLMTQYDYFDRRISEIIQLFKNNYSQYLSAQAPSSGALLVIDFLDRLQQRRTAYEADYSKTIALLSKTITFFEPNNPPSDLLPDEVIIDLRFKLRGILSAGPLSRQELQELTDRRANVENWKLEKDIVAGYSAIRISRDLQFILLLLGKQIDAHCAEIKKILDEERSLSSTKQTNIRPLSLRS